MSMIGKLKKLSGLAAALIVMQGGNVSADSVDNLQAALANGVYTIRYENVTPPSRSSVPKEKVHLVQQSGIFYHNNKDDFEDTYMMYQVVTGVATSDGKNQYSEYTSRHIEEAKEGQDGQGENFDYTTCSLNLGDESFYFTRTNKKGEVQYISNRGQNKVAAFPTYYQNAA